MIEPTQKICIVLVIAVWIFYGCSQQKNAVDILVDLNQSRFKSGDEIELTTRFKACDNTILFIEEKDTKSIRIFVRGGNGEDVDINDTNFYWPQNPYNLRGPGKKISLRKNEDYVVKIKGQVDIDPDSGVINFNFGDFGTIAKSNKYSSFLVGVTFAPWDFDSSDSLEYFSNHTWIVVKN